MVLKRQSQCIILRAMVTTLHGRPERDHGVVRKTIDARACGSGRVAMVAQMTHFNSLIATLLRTFSVPSVHTSLCHERQRRPTSDASGRFSLIAAAEHQRRVGISHLIATLSVRALASVG